MLWLREAHFGFGKNPIVFVIEETSLKDDIHVVANEGRARFGDELDVEIFEWPQDINSATLEAVRRSQFRIPEKIRKMDILHDYLISTLIRSKKNTFISPTRPTPLDAADIRQILTSVVSHGAYKGQIIFLRSQDKKTVVVEGGAISVKDFV